MSSKNGIFSKSVITTRQLSSKDSGNLIDAGFPFPKATLQPFLADRFYKLAKLMPREIGLVAYHNKEKRAVGYLCLVAHTNSLYSIKYVFSDPRFRRIGIATRLMNHALHLAKKRGAKKVFLTTYPNSAATKLYQKIGFKRIVNSFFVKGEGCTSNFLLQSRDPQITLRPSPKSSRLLYSIYHRSLGQDWINFFETNTKNLTNGYSQDFKHFFLKTIFIDASADFFAMVFNLPLTSTAFCELYSSSDSFFPSRIKDLMIILQKRGITYTKITLFNIENTECFNLLREKRFYPYQAVYMGNSLR